ncbi:MAG: TRAP transporter small permease subunit [Proteobacteria bacterium]|nr:TRAP transporter small permease subunit [Pseudomonadota bacterium]
MFALVKFIGRLSMWVARIELASASLLAAAITLLILLNVVTRTLGLALFWVDELAIYAMVWMTFLGASAGIHYNHTIAITFLTNLLPKPVRTIVAKLVDGIVFIFAILIVWLCWRWFDPLELARLGFDVAAFQGATFNFIYAEPTTTLGIKKYPIWLVMWIFAFGITLHSLVHLLSPARGHEESP